MLQHYPHDSLIPLSFATSSLTRHRKNQQRYIEPLTFPLTVNLRFLTVNSVTGETGMKQAQDEYDKLIRNKTPKSRRS